MEQRKAMHPLYPKASELTAPIIGAAIEVHRDKGPGLIESIYEWCLLHELKLHGLTTENQRVVRITYKGIFRDEPPAVRRARGRLCDSRNQIGRTNPARPQGPTPELHETPQRAARIAHKLQCH